MRWGKSEKKLSKPDIEKLEKAKAVVADDYKKVILNMDVKELESFNKHECKENMAKSMSALLSETDIPVNLIVYECHYLSKANEQSCQ